EVLARDEERMLADPAWNEPINDSERGFIETLAQRFTPEQIAAGYLRLYRARQSAPEDLMAPGAEPAPRARNAESFGPSAWFSVSLGRNQNTEPRWLLPMLCRAGDITKDDIGAIRIQPDESFVEIRASSVPGFLAAIGPDLMLEEGTAIRQLEHAPDLSRAPRPAPAPRRAHSERPERAPDAERKPRAPKPAWEPAQTPPPGVAAPDRKPRAPKPHGDKAPYAKPKGDKPAYGKPAYGKSHADKPGFAKKPAFRKDDGDGAKPAWKKSDRPGAARPAAPARARANAADPSQRFNPKGAAPKPGTKRTGPGDGKGGKPKGPRGTTTPPRRG
ncbi:MAG: DbpA RNA binding domain-containing protein, partial [Paracoccaceae bacterium]